MDKMKGSLFAVMALATVSQAAPEPVFYESPEITVKPTVVEREGKEASVDPATGAITSHAHFRMKDQGDVHVPAERLERPMTWTAKHDHSGLPRLQTGFPTIDAACRLALDEVLTHLEYEPVGLLNASEGRPPWVRDTAYVVLMGADALFPEATRKTLEWAVIPGETIKPEQVSALMDMPIKMHYDFPDRLYRMGDFVLWIPAAWQYARTSGDRNFMAEFYDEMAASLDLAEDVLYDPYDGLYDGGETIGDGSTAYPEGVTGRVPVKGSSVNFIYYKALLSMAEIGEWLGKPASESATYRARAIALRDAINRRLWLPEQGFFSLYQIGRSEHPIERATLAGNSFAVLWNGTSAERRNSIFENLPDSPWGAPLLWPSLLNRWGYHDQNVWPVIEGLWGTANAAEGSLDRLVKSLALYTANGAFSLSFSEMWGAYDGSYRGKEPQLWSCTAFLMEIFQGLLGVEPQLQGLLIQPAMPAPLASGVTVNGYPYREARLNFKLSGQGRGIASFTVNGKPALNLIPPDASGELAVEVELTDDLPFGFEALPASVGRASGETTVFRVASEGNVPGLVLLVLSPGRSEPTEIPVTDGKAAVDFDRLLPNGSGEVQVALVSRDASGQPRQMTHWHPVLVRPALALHWEPGAVEFSRPVGDGERKALDLVVTNVGESPRKAALNLPRGEGFALSADAQSVHLEPGESVKVPVSFMTKAPLDYGRYDTIATVSAEGLDVQALLAVRIEESIDLRGAWNAKVLPEGEPGESFELNDRDGQWAYVKLPARWRNLKGFEESDGPVWFRKHLLVPTAWKGHELELHFGEISGKPKVFFNERLIEPSLVKRSEFRYRIPREAVRPGDNNLIAVFVEPTAPGLPKTGLTSWPMELRVLPEGSE